jgi:hypothetical protein
MCKRRDSVKAQNAAADQLLAACRSVRPTFRQALNTTLTAPLPADFTELLGQIGQPATEGARRAKRY